ncbi:GAF domain-containing sensor histidine kinase [Clostridium sp. CS001]|uniref:GAF domain-containing sensor histidine kinase n=1 Tax=Clostridium sp. CS001 TaxID=2880648 RepID=UPI001CF2D4D4|nr:GAF domain-containing sensor histidine kinase [Clostridium sp. CS001]MCB2291247.1 GAF domain-containing sensor histidine kinase [Clostridium sp. CS001]
MIEVLGSKWHLYIVVVIAICIAVIHIKIKMLTIKNNKAFDKRIGDIISIFNSTTDIKDIFNRLLKYLQETLGYDAAISMSKDDENFELMVCNGYNDEINLGSYFKEAKCTLLIKKIMACSKPYYIQDLKKLEYEKYIKDFNLILYNMRSVLVIPIIYRGKIYGVVTLLNHKKSAYNEKQQSKAFSFASQVAVAIENAMLFQKLTDMDKIKTDFLSTVSHELRTPLTSIIGFAEMVKRKFEGSIVEKLDLTNEKNLNDVSKIRRNVNIILSEGERLASLINDLLDISRMEAGKDSLDLVETDIEEIIDKAITVTKPIIKGKPIQVIQNIRESLPKIMADKDKLMQVIINLISNAIKFTEEGCIVCTARRLDEDIILSITDTGIGIKEEDKEYIFNRFSQVGDNLTSRPRGTGLGLSICKHIIEAHGGEIWAESEVGKGTDFSFRIPISMAKEVI